MEIEREITAEGIKDFFGPDKASRVGIRLLGLAKGFIPYSEELIKEYKHEISLFNLLPHNKLKCDHSVITKDIFELENSAFLKDIKIEISNDIFIFKIGACDWLYKRLQPKEMITNGTFLLLQENNNDNKYCLLSENEDFLLVFDMNSIAKVENFWQKKYKGNVLLGWKGPNEILRKKKTIRHMPIWTNNENEIIFRNEIPLMMAYSGGENNGKDKIKISCRIYAKEKHILQDQDMIRYGENKKYAFELKKLDELKPNPSKSNMDRFDRPNLNILNMPHELVPDKQDILSGSVGFTVGLNYNNGASSVYEDDNNNNNSNNSIYDYNYNCNHNYDNSENVSNYDNNCDCDDCDIGLDISPPPYKKFRLW